MLLAKKDLQNFIKFKFPDLSFDFIGDNPDLIEMLNIRIPQYHSNGECLKLKYIGIHKYIDKNYHICIALKFTDNKSVDYYMNSSDLYKVQIINRKNKLLIIKNAII